MAPRLVVVGPPGAGKSTVGRLVAARLGELFLDSDDVVEQRARRSISDIFFDDGEPAFRELERTAVSDLLAEAAGIVSLGGGAVLDPLTEQDLASQRVVFLDVAIADAARRVGFGQHRPLLSINPRAQWTQLMQARRPVYERVATFVVDTAGRPATEVADAVLQQLAVAEAAS
jgi:shikimate kinase